MPEGLPLPGLPIPIPRRGRGRRIVDRETGEEFDSLEDFMRAAAARRAAQQQAAQELPLPAQDIPQPVDATPTAPEPTRQQRRADRQAARLERREARRAARAARGPRTLPPGLFQVLGGLFGGGSVPTASPSRLPTPGEIRTQAARGTPMSLLGNIGSALGTLATGYVQKRLQQPLPSVPMRTLQGAGMTAARGARALVSLPGAGQRFTTGGQFGVGLGIPAGFGRKRKRTNPTNVRALRRALSRVEGFIKIEKRVDKILRRMAPKARAAQKVGFVKRRRR